ncbi:hypothetical protein HQQ80_20570 [Microbacteriaceae bacterium VKM Ac-2855]|nr:hypothetical protein [Microbacteriaceae bacterium VKM Ac-2855]
MIACSALRRRYRESILAAAPSTVFVHLDGRRDVLAERMRSRSEHFMPASLLDSQLATLERLDPDEPGFVVDIDAPVDRIVEAARVGLTAWA